MLSILGSQQPFQLPCASTCEACASGGVVVGACSVVPAVWYLQYRAGIGLEGTWWHLGTLIAPSCLWEQCPARQYPFLGTATAIPHFTATDMRWMWSVSEGTWWLVVAGRGSCGGLMVLVLCCQRGGAPGGGWGWRGGRGGGQLCESPWCSERRENSDLALAKIRPLI